MWLAINATHIKQIVLNHSLIAFLKLSLDWFIVFILLNQEEKLIENKKCPGLHNNTMIRFLNSKEFYIMFLVRNAGLWSKELVQHNRLSHCSVLMVQV